MRGFRRKFIILLSFIILLPLFGTNLLANEDNLSYHSEPEKFPYESVDFRKREIVLQDNWKFHYGDVSGAQHLTYSDLNWKNVSVPHDYSLELNYDLRNGEAESGYKLGGIGWYRKIINIPSSQSGRRFVAYFDGVYNNAEVYINGNLLGTHPYGYTPFAFDLTPYIQYGADNLLAVKVNHQFPSSRWYSGSGIYRPVKLIVTDDVFVDLWGVKITNSDFNPDELGSVQTTVETVVVNDAQQSKNIEVRQTILDAQGQQVVSGNKTVEVASKGRSTVSINLDVQTPSLWSLDNPYLYKVKTELLVDGTVKDTAINDYGFRKIVFDRNTGFALNGVKMKLQGVSMHHDQGALGARAFKDAIERQVDILKEMGVNAIRVTHNPASEVLIEAANKKGMLLIEEFFDTWFRPKNGNPHDYSKAFAQSIGSSNKIIGKENDEMTWAQFDVHATVKRGINAPSIIAWSLGNELQEGLSNYNDPQKTYERMGTTMSNWVYAIDRSRMVTFGDNKIKAGWKNVTEIADNIARATEGGKGLIGLNYAEGGVFDSRFNSKQNWILYASETSSAVNSRGFYKRLAGGGQSNDQNLTSYDNSRVGWGHMSAHSWFMVVQRDYVAGEFVWTGFDYLGEPTPWNGVGRGAQAGNNSPKSSYFGIVDLAGLPKDRYYFYRSQWNKKDTTLHMLPVWKENAIVIDRDGNVKVDIYTNARTVKLLFKEQGSEEWSEIGSKTFSVKRSKAAPNQNDNGIYSYQFYEGEGKSNRPYENLYLSFKVPYKAGTLKAVAYDEAGQAISQTVGRNEITTYGNPYKLDIEASKKVLNADGSSLSYLTVSVKDENGNVVEDANLPITVNVDGEAVVFEAQDNGRQNDLTPYTNTTRNTFNGKSVVILRATKKGGTSTVTLSSPGLQPASIEVSSTKENESSQVDINAYEMVKNYYYPIGASINPISDLKVFKTDGTTDNDTIVWENLSEVNANTTGLYTIRGVSQKYKIEVSAQVNIVAQVAAVLNYSTAVSVGETELRLPETRPAVLRNGDLLRVEFPVKWDMESSNLNLQQAGTYVVNGVSTILNKQYPVTATIRVSEKTRIEGDNVARGASLSQNLEITSDRLEAINDGRIGMNTGNVGNENIWTNYKHSLQGPDKNNAEITLTYATNTIADKLVVYWYQDSWAATLPESVELFHKQDEEEWTKIENVQVEVGETQENGGRVTKYTYTFDRKEFLHFKLSIKGKQGKTGKRDGENREVYYCVGIGELQLFGSKDELVLNSEFLPTGTLLNGNNLVKDGIEQPKQVVESAAALNVGNNIENVAITKLPIYEDKQIFFLESEDNQTRKKVVVLLNQSEQPLSLNDSSRDVDRNSIQYNVTNSANGNPIGSAFDNNLNTFWHNDWNRGRLQDEQRYIEMVLAEPTRIDGVRYHKRMHGGNNGTVRRYSVKIARENSEEFEEVANGTWNANENRWQLATFEPVVAKKVRLYGVETIGDGGRTNHFMSAAEIRVRKAKVDAVDLNSVENLVVNIEGLEDKVIDETEGRIRIKNNQSYVVPNVSVRADQITLVENVDYTLDYQDNYQVGVATVRVVGVGNYKGVITKKYEIYSPFEIENNISNEKISVKVVSNELKELDANKLYSGYKIVLSEHEFEERLRENVPADVLPLVELDGALTYQIKLLDNSRQSVQPLPGSKFKVYISLPEELKESAINQKLKVLHYHEQDGALTVEVMNYSWDESEEKIFVVMDKFSKIVVLRPMTAIPVDTTEQFKQTHKDALSKTVDNVTIEDEEKVINALNAYNDLSEDVKAKLETEKQLLESLKAKIMELKGSTEKEDKTSDNNTENKKEEKQTPAITVVGKPTSNVVVTKKLLPDTGAERGFKFIIAASLIGASLIGLSVLKKKEK